jgi:hypothetical protein
MLGGALGERHAGELQERKGKRQERRESHRMIRGMRVKTRYYAVEDGRRCKGPE